MATKTWWGGGNNDAGNPWDWSPYGTPKPGDMVVMTHGTMNVEGFQLAYNAVQLGAETQGRSVTFDLSNNALLTVQVPASNQLSAGASANFLVSGYDVLHLLSGTVPAADFNVYLNRGAVLDFAASLGRGSLAISGASNTELVNNASDTMNGVYAVINEDVVGVGSFNLGFAYQETGFLEFTKSVASGETVQLGGTLPSRLKLDHPNEFHGTVDFTSGTAELDNLGQATFWSLSNDVLKIWSGTSVIDTLKVGFTGAPYNANLSVAKGSNGAVYVSNLGYPGAGQPLMQSHIFS